MHLYEIPEAERQAEHCEVLPVCRARALSYANFPQAVDDNLAKHPGMQEAPPAEWQLSFSPLSGV